MQQFCCSWRGQSWAVACLMAAHLSGGLNEPAAPLSRAGEGGVKRLAKAVDAGAATVASLLAEHTQPALEAAAFQLAELHGLAHCTRWLAPLGLEARPRDCRV